MWTYDTPTRNWNSVLVGVKVAKLVAVDYDKSVDLESF